jgi:hypothetical protein
MKCQSNKPLVRQSSDASGFVALGSVCKRRVARNAPVAIGGKPFADREIVIGLFHDGKNPGGTGASARRIGPSTKPLAPMPWK